MLLNLLLWELRPNWILLNLLFRFTKSYYATWVSFIYHVFALLNPFLEWSWHLINYFRLFFLIFNLVLCFWTYTSTLNLTFLFWILQILILFLLLNNLKILFSIFEVFIIFNHIWIISLFLILIIIVCLIIVYLLWNFLLMIMVWSTTHRRGLSFKPVWNEWWLVRCGRYLPFYGGYMNFFIIKLKLLLTMCSFQQSSSTTCRLIMLGNHLLKHEWLILIP